MTGEISNEFSNPPTLNEIISNKRVTWRILCIIAVIAAIIGALAYGAIVLDIFKTKTKMSTSIAKQNNQSTSNKLTFVKDNSIYISDLDGSNQKKLVESKQIAIKTRKGFGGNGNLEKYFLLNLKIGSFAWSPDKKTLAYARAGVVELLNKESNKVTEIRKLTDIPKIKFFHKHQGVDFDPKVDIVTKCPSTCEKASSNDETSGDYLVVHLRWSPDGKKLLYWYTVDKGSHFPIELNLTNLEGKSKKIESIDDGNNIQVTWAPDSSVFIYGGGGNSNYLIVIIWIRTELHGDLKALISICQHYLFFGQRMGTTYL